MLTFVVLLLKGAYRSKFITQFSVQHLTSCTQYEPHTNHILYSIIIYICFLCSRSKQLIRKNK